MDVAMNGVEFTSKYPKPRGEGELPTIGSERCLTIIPGRGQCLWPRGHGTDHEAGGWEAAE